MKNKNVLLNSKFFAGLFLGLILGCGVGFSIGNSNTSPATSNLKNEITELPAKNINPTYTQIFIPTTTITFTPVIIETLTPFVAVTSSPIILNIPFTSCGDHVAYSASTQLYSVPIIENDIAIAEATWVIVNFNIKNTYVNTSIEGFAIHISPGYSNPDLYPDTLFNGNAPFQPNEEVELKSSHLFLPDGWSFQEHTKAFLKFPEILAPKPRSNEYTVGGYIINFQIIEKFGMLDNYKEEKRCDGAIKIQ